MREIDALAHSLALENSLAAVHSASSPGIELGQIWLVFDPAQTEECRGELQYLEMRGAIERHPSQRNWLRIVQPGAVG